ncbi:MAG: beta-lactamase family protein [Actinobacteria bacterium]|nr:beta-lactamase family protein [Actinomycetota bacterium]
MTALDLTKNWPVPNVSAATLRAGKVTDTIGDVDRRQRLASISKPLTTWAMLVAVEEGVIGLDTPVGQDGCTLEHLLSHAGGYPFEGPTAIAKPGRTRIYSNTGFDLATEAIELATDMAFADYLDEAVFAPLGMGSSELLGSAAKDVHSSLADVCAFIEEVHTPTLISAQTADGAINLHYPSLAGIVPGVGRYTPCPWGLGFELRGEKQPHWTGTRNSPHTFGHFGGAGTMFWVDPEVDVALVALTDRPFDAWALSAWPELSDAVLDEVTNHTQVAEADAVAQ